MCTKSSSATAIVLQRIVALVVFCTALALGSAAQAITINFDDLEYIPGDPDCFCDHPLTDQYLSKGLLINDGFLAQYGSVNQPNVVSPPNYLLGGNYLQLLFVGDLPTYVSMYVSASREEVIYLDAYGTSGLLARKKTTGYGGPFDDTPYTPKQFIEFDLPEGIKEISLQGFYGRSTAAEVDNLKFKKVLVPEPSALILLGFSGLLVLRRHRKVLAA